MGSSTAPSRVGPYVLLAELARGGMGVVFRARHPVLDRDVALKVLLHGARSTPQQRERFLREARALARLDHPNVVRVHDAGFDGRELYLVLDLVQGETLAARLARGPLPVDQARELARKLALALAHAHERGVLHRDVKPDNVLLRADGEPLLMDFGLTRDVDTPSHDHLSRTGAWLGTPGWWSPEQAHGHTQAIGPATDVYGLGATLYSALTGRPPIEGETLSEVLAGEQRPVVPPSRLRQGIPPALDALVRRCLAAQPAQRYPTASALAAALEAVQPSAAAPRGIGQGLLLPLSSAIAIVLSGVVGVLLVRRREPERPSTSAQVASAAPAGPAARSRSPAEERVERARALRQAGDLVRARQELEQALAEDPRCAMAHHERYALCVAGGDPVRGLSDLERAVELAPADTFLARELAGLRGRRGDLIGALAELDRALGLREDVLLLAMRAELRQGQGDTAGALADAERALVLEPESAFSRAIRARVRQVSGDLDGALADCDAVLATGSKDPTAAGAALLTRAEVQNARGQHEGALADLRRAREVGVEVPRVFMLEGELLVLRKDFAGARVAFDGAVRLVPGDWRALGNRATARKLSGDLQGAIVDFTAALRLVPRDGPDRALIEAQLQQLSQPIPPGEPGSLQDLVQRAREQRERGDVAGALALFDQVVARYPAAFAAYHGRATTRSKAGDLAGALADYERALALQPDHVNARNDRALVLYRRGDMEGALRDLDRILAREPDNALVLENRAGIRSDRGDAAALADWDRVLALRPDDPRALSGRAGLRCRLGDLDGALADAERALAVDPRCAIAWANRGYARRVQGRLPEALADVDRALELDASLQMAWATRGVLLMQLERLDESLTALGRAIELAPGNAFSWSSRAAAHLAAGKLEAARDDATRAIELEPGNATGWANRGVARSKLGDPAGALSDLQRARELPGLAPGQVESLERQLEAARAALGR